MELKQAILNGNRTDTAFFKCIRYIFFVESRAERGSQQKIWFYQSAKRCIENLLRDLGEDTAATARDVRQDGSVETATKIEQISQLLSQASRNVK